MKYKDIILGTTDDESIDGGVVEKFERVMGAILYSRSIMVMGPGLINLSFQVGDDLLRDIASEICDGCCRKHKLVRSRKILLLVKADAVYSPDLCFSLEKKRSSVTGEFQDLQDYLSDALTRENSEKEVSA